MKRFFKGFFGMLFMLLAVAYIIILVFMIINHVPNISDSFSTVCVGIMGAIGFIMFSTAIKNESIF